MGAQRRAGDFFSLDPHEMRRGKASLINIYNIFIEKNQIFFYNYMFLRAKIDKYNIKDFSTKNLLKSDRI